MAEQQAAGHPVARARVTVVDGSGVQIDVATTSEDGRFAARGQEQGWVTVLASAPGARAGLGAAPARRSGRAPQLPPRCGGRPRAGYAAVPASAGAVLP